MFPRVYFQTELCSFRYTHTRCTTLCMRVCVCNLGMLLLQLLLLTSLFPVFSYRSFVSCSRCLLNSRTTYIAKQFFFFPFRENEPNIVVALLLHRIIHITTCKVQKTSFQTSLNGVSFHEQNSFVSLTNQFK